MTPTPQHQEQAEVMARGIAAAAICQFFQGRVLPMGEWEQKEREFALKVSDTLNLPELLAYQVECERLRKALKRIASIVETGQGCSINNHDIAVICLDTL